jgi:hypothetical protein
MKFVYFLVFILLTGCVAHSVSSEAGVGVGGGAAVSGGAAASRAAPVDPPPQNLAPAPAPEFNTQQEPGAEESSIEEHAAVSPEACLSMFRSMERDQRNVTMLRPRFVGGTGPLKWICRFRVTPPDSANSGYYSDRDTRYNSSREFDSP